MFHVMSTNKSKKSIKEKQTNEKLEWFVDTLFPIIRAIIILSDITPCNKNARFFSYRKSAKLCWFEKQDWKSIQSVTASQGFLLNLSKTNCNFFKSIFGIFRVFGNTLSKTFGNAFSKALDNRFPKLFGKPFSKLLW